MNLISIVHGIIFIINHSLAFFIYFKNPKAGINIVGSLLLFLIGLMSLFNILLNNPLMPMDSLVLFSDINILAIYLFSALFFIFSLVLAGIDFSPKVKLVSFLVFSAALTTGLGQIFFDILEKDITITDYGLVVFFRNPNNYFYHISSVTFVMLFSFYILFRSARKAKIEYKKKKLFIILLVLLIPFLGALINSVIYFISKNITYPLIGNIIYVIWSTGFVISILKYNLFEISPEMAARNIISTMPDALILTDFEGKIVEINNETIRILGLTSFKDIVGKNIDYFFSIDLMHSLISNEEFRNHELEIINFSGKKIFLELSSTFLKKSPNENVGIVCILKDITKKRIAEKDLATSEMEYRGLFQNMVNGFFYAKIILNNVGDAVDFEFLKVNNVFEELYLKPSQLEVVGKKITDIYPDFKSLKFDWINFFGKIALTGVSTSVEEYFEPSDKYFSVNAYSPRKFYIAVIFEDITLQVKAKKENLKLQEQLKQQDRLATIGRFAAGVAHELNEPLSNILGFAELIKKDEKNRSLQTEKDLNSIIKASLGARMIIKQLLTFARQTTSEKRPIDINQTIVGSLDFFDSRLQRKNINLRYNLSNTLAPVFADPSQINQIVVNLIVNSLNAMPDGGIISISTYDVGKDIVLEVEDEGIGIEKEIINNIFDPFFTTKDVHESSGLGLSIVHGLVTLHNASIKIESEPLKGTKVTIFFPKDFKTENIVSEEILLN